MCSYTCIACFPGAQPRVPSQQGTRSPAGVSPGILATLFMVLVISFGSTGLPTHACAALGLAGIHKPLPTICFVHLTKLSLQCHVFLMRKQPNKRLCASSKVGGGASLVSLAGVPAAVCCCLEDDACPIIFMCHWLQCPGHSAVSV